MDAVQQTENRNKSIHNKRRQQNNDNISYVSIVVNVLHYYIYEIYLLKFTFLYSHVYLIRIKTIDNQNMIHFSINFNVIYPPIGLYIIQNLENTHVI